MRSIIVEPDRLEATASRIEEAKSSYDLTYKSIYSEVDKLATSWQGKDNTAFCEQLKGYEDDFQQISIIMSQYANFLRNSAKGYRETQDELYSQAIRLKA